MSAVTAIGPRASRLIWLSLSAVLLVLVCFAAPARAAEPFDDLPGVAVGSGSYESAAFFDQTVEFDSAKFTQQPAEKASPGRYLACNVGGTKDGWVRFATAVAGNLMVEVNTAAGVDPFYKVWTAPNVTSVLTGIEEIGCESQSHTTFEEYGFGYPVPAGQIAYVQVLDQCDATPAPGTPGRPCEPAEEEAPGGGLTKVRLRFTPFNADGDAFPDTLDACPNATGTFRGCPDSDGDGVGDADDACPMVPGKAANGCRRPDEDGDGYIAAAAGGNDCNDNDAAINPGATDLPHDGIDQNCDGHDADYPSLSNEVARVFAYSKRLKRTVGFLSPFKVAGPLAPGMTVRLTCTGRGCPFSREAIQIKPSQTGGVLIGKKLVRQILAPHSVVTLLITRPGYYGKALRFTVRKHGKMGIEELCAPPGSVTPQKQCT
jgi:Putative metal-binding motif